MALAVAMFPAIGLGQISSENSSSSAKIKCPSVEETYAKARISASYKTVWLGTVEIRKYE